MYVEELLNHSQAKRNIRIMVSTTFYGSEVGSESLPLGTPPLNLPLYIGDFLYQELDDLVLLYQKLQDWIYLLDKDLLRV